MLIDGIEEFCNRLAEKHAHDLYIKISRVNLKNGDEIILDDFIKNRIAKLLVSGTTLVIMAAIGQAQSGTEFKKAVNKCRAALSHVALSNNFSFNFMFPNTVTLDLNNPHTFDALNSIMEGIISDHTNHLIRNYGDGGSQTIAMLAS